MTRELPEKVSIGGYIWAALAVALMLIGRWSPSRILNNEFDDLFWVAKLAGLLVVAIMAIGPGDTRDERRIATILPFLLMSAYVLLSYLWNRFWLEYADSKLLDLAFNLALVCAISIGLKRSRLREAFWPVLIAYLGVMAAIGLISLSTVISGSVDGRLAVLGGGPNVFGRNMGLLVLMGLFFGLHKPELRVICAVLAGAALIGLIASGSRGALLATLLGLSVLFIVDKTSRDYFFKRPLVMFLFVLMAASVSLATDIGTVADVGSARITEQTLELGNWSSRDILIIVAYEFWMEAPIFGNGLGSFAAVLQIEYPHNIFLEFASETGVVGVLLFTFLLVRFVRYQIRFGGDNRGVVLSLAATLLVAAMISGDFVDSRLLFLMLVFPVSSSRDQRDLT